MADKLAYNDQFNSRKGYAVLNKYATVVVGTVTLIHYESRREGQSGFLAPSYLHALLHLLITFFSNYFLKFAPGVEP